MSIGDASHDAFRTELVGLFRDAVRAAIQIANDKGITELPIREEMVSSFDSSDGERLWQGNIHRRVDYRSFSARIREALVEDPSFTALDCAASKYVDSLGKPYNWLECLGLSKQPAANLLAAYFNDSNSELRELDQSRLNDTRIIELADCFLNEAAAAQRPSLSRAVGM